MAGDPVERSHGRHLAMDRRDRIDVELIGFGADRDRQFECPDVPHDLLRLEVAVSIREVRLCEFAVGDVQSLDLGRGERL
ncbi:MAG TPA: hypothetical protein VHV53_05050 [Solirubrobacterales bacterium]|nr:hypothetical protein [Solirubrobacterales bacterium]